MIKYSKEMGCIMKAIGIIAEYNPFHNGHLYQINKIKEKYPNYCIIVVMSGHFTERGDVTIIDKWKRTKTALLNGVDLVIELPFPFATQSADFFAYGGVTILEYLGVERIIFGSENDNIGDLKLIAETQLNNPDFDKLVKIYSKMGKNYPTALSCSLEDLTGKRIDSPNDLLGISYIKTILKNNYKIIPEVIKRTNNYHDIELDNNISSASAIREAIKNNIDITNNIPYNEINDFNNTYFIDDYFDILKYKIITDNDLSIYQTVDEGIDKLLKKEIVNCSCFDDLIKRVKSKRYTYNKISRMLIHILCNFTKEKANNFRDIKYIRILGLNINGKRYLNSIKKNIDIPIISKITRDKDPMLEFEIDTTNIYDIIKNNDLVNEEFRSIIYIGDDYYDKK